MPDDLPTETALVQLIVQGLTNAEIAEQLGWQENTAAKAVKRLLTRLGKGRAQLMLEWVTDNFGTLVLPTSALFADCRDVAEPLPTSRPYADTFARLAAWRLAHANTVAGQSAAFALQAIESSDVPLRTVRFMYMKALLGLQALSPNLLFFYSLVGQGSAYSEIAKTLQTVQKKTDQLRTNLLALTGLNAVQAVLDYNRRIPPSAEERAKCRDALTLLTPGQLEVAQALTEHWIRTAPISLEDRDKEESYVTIGNSIGVTRGMVAKSVSESCGRWNREGNHRLVLYTYFVAHHAPTKRTV